MTPIKQGTARKLGLRKPLPPLEIELSFDTAAFHRAIRGMQEFMARNDSEVRAAFARLTERLQAERNRV